MDVFLKASKKCLENLGEYSRVRVVLGNPTCDLDSAVCALAHGFFEHEELKSKEDVGVVPVMNVTRDEFRLKTEVVYYLRKFGVDKELLTFRNEINLKELQAAGKLELVLVDHHALPAEDAHLSDSVIEVIDHRPHDTAWPWTGCRLNLVTVGSCATLVSQNILNRRPEVLGPSIAGLLQGPILIDTVNFSKEADRATKLDHEIIGQLDKICGSDAATRTELYQQILDAKTDISELTPGDLLIKDLKVVNGIPIPGFPILVKDFLELEGAMQALEAFQARRNCQIVVLIGMDLKKDRVTRDIAVYSLGSDRAANKIMDALMSSTSPSLQLTESRRLPQERDAVDSSSDARGDPAKPLVVLYEQGNARATRKQILPIVQSAA